MTATATKKQQPTAAVPAPTPDALADLICEYALEKKASGLLVLDVSGVVSYTDRFVICSGGSDRQTKAIADSIQTGVKQETRLVPEHIEGLQEAQWILLDYLDVVVHIFTPEMRSSYRLEQLWADVPSREVSDE